MPNRRLSPLVCLALLLAAPPARAAMEGGAGAKVGDGGASVPGVALSAEAAVGTGGATTSIRIEVPQGRGGMQPNLILMYSSQASAMSQYGAGWALPIGAIQRSTRRGVPKYGAADVFVAAMPDGVVDLVALGANKYGARIDEGHFVATADPAQNTWTLHDTSGRTYTFGCLGGPTVNCGARVGRGTALSPIPTTFDATYAWHVIQITDANGNRVDYSYSQATGRAAPDDQSGIPYLSQIAWGGNGTFSNIFTVAPVWADRPAGSERLAVSKGFREYLTKELSKVEVRYRGTLVRTYELTMATSHITGNRLLTRVKRRGRGKDSTDPGPVLTLDDGTTAAETVFTYNEATPAAFFEAASVPLGYRLPGPGVREIGANVDVGTLDLDGDGRPDEVLANGTIYDPSFVSTGAWQIWFNRGRSAGAPFQGSSPSGCSGPPWQCASSCSDGTGCVPWVAPLANLSTGPLPECLDRVQGTCVEFAFPNKLTGAMADMDGDLLPDRITSGGGANWKVYKNLGTGFATTPDPPTNGPKWTPEGAPEVQAGQYQESDDLPDDPQDYRLGPGTYGDLIDVNGDGRPDYVRSSGWTAGTPNWRVNFNNGNGFDATVDVRGFGHWLRIGGSAATSNDPTTGSTLRDMLVDMFDINGDGLPDKVRAMGNRNVRGCTGYHFQVWLGTGRDFVGRDTAGNPYCWPSPPVNRLRKWDDEHTAKWDIIDVTGDGLPDFVDARPWTPTNRYWHLWRNTGARFVDVGDLIAPVELRTQISADPPNIQGTEDATGTTIVQQDLLDVDGDGWLDAVSAKDGGAVYWGHPGRWRVDSLAQIDNPTGDRYTFTYAVSSDFNDAQVDPLLYDGKLHLPLPVWVVSAVTRSAAGLASETTTYAYRGGYYDVTERDFRGFHYTYRTGPDGIVEVTTIHQTDALKGKVAESGVYKPGSGETLTNPLTRTVSTWKCGSQASCTRAGAPGCGATADCPVQLLPTDRVFPELRQIDSFSYSSTLPNQWLAGAARVKGSLFTYDACGNAVQDITNEVTSLVSTASPNPAPVADANAQISEAEYNAADDATPAVTVNGCNSTTRTCDLGVCNRATRTIERGGVTKSLRYDGRKGNAIKTVAIGEGDPETTVSYDAMGLPETTINPLLTKSVVTYDADKLFASTTTASAGDGSVSTQLITRTAYDTVYSQVLSSQDPNGAVTRNVFDAFGRLCKTYLPDDPYAPSSTDPCATPDGTADAPTTYTKYHMYVGGARTDTFTKISRTRYLPSTTFVDAYARPIQSQTIREIGGVEKVVITQALSYDAVGRQLIGWSPMIVDGTTDTTVRHAVPRAAGDGYTQYYYDEFGRRILSLGPDGNRVETSFQTAWTTRSCDANHGANPKQGQCSETEIDFAGRTLERRVYAGDATGGSWYSKERSAYDRDGRTVTVTQNGNGATARLTTFDLLGRKKTADDPDTGHAGTVGHWAFEYDKGGNVVYENDPQTNQHVEFSYDGFGRLVSRWQRKGSDTRGAGTAIELAHFTYDCPDTCGNPGVPNGLGRTCTITEHDPMTGDDTGGTAILAYDRRGNITSQKKTIKFKKPGATVPVVQTYTGSSVYDVQTGRLEKTTYPTAIGSEWIYYVYSSTGQVQKVQTDSGELLSDLTHDVLGRPADVLMRNGMRDKFTYRTAAAGAQLDRVRTVKDGVTGDYRNVHYRTYDPNGNVMAIRDELYTQHDLITATATVFYDRLSRVRRVAQCSRGSLGPYQGSFATDAYANLTTKDGLSRTVGSKPHQLASAQSRNAAGTVQTSPITYDDNGNVTSLSDSRTATYDVGNNLLEVRKSGIQKTVYRYDNTGQRVVSYDVDKNETVFFFGGFDVRYEAGTITRHFRAAGRAIASSTVTGTLTSLAPGDDPTSRSMLAAQIGVSGAGALGAVLLGFAIAVPGRTRRRAFGRVRRSTVAVLAIVFWLVQLPLPAVTWATSNPTGPAPFNTVFYHVDHVGTPRMLTDENAGVVEYLATDPYGVPYSVYDGNRNPRTTSKSAFQFTGHRAVDGAGLIYMGARFYDPTLGQFLSHDPSREFYSPYSYTNGNPMNHTDPSGKCELFCIIALILIAISVVYAGVTAGVQASQNGASLGEAIGAGLKAAVITAAIAAVGWIVGGYIIGPILGPTLSTALDIALAGYSVYQGVSAIAAGDYGAGAFAVAAAAVSLAGAAYSVAHNWPKQKNNPSDLAGTQLAADSSTMNDAYNVGFDPALDKPLETPWLDPIDFIPFGAMVKGGIRIIRGIGTIAEEVVAEDALKVGDKIYRAFGADAKGVGRFWSKVNPAETADYAAKAGLPSEKGITGYAGRAYNSGGFVAEGTVIDATGVQSGAAQALHGQPGGGITEFVFPKPEAQIRIDRVYGVNPSLNP